MRIATVRASAVTAVAVTTFAAAPTSTNANGAVTTTAASQAANPTHHGRVRPSTMTRAPCPMMVVTGHGQGAPSEGAESRANASTPIVASAAATQGSRTASGSAPAIARLVANAASRCTP
jgi:hypothetical protein